MSVVPIVLATAQTQSLNVNEALLTTTMSPITHTMLARILKYCVLHSHLDMAPEALDMADHPEAELVDNPEAELERLLMLLMLRLLDVRLTSHASANHANKTMTIWASSVVQKYPVPILSKNLYFPRI